MHGCRQRRSNDFWNENYSSLRKHLLLSLGCLLLRVKHHWTACRTALLLSKHASSGVAAGVFVKGVSGNLQFFMSWPDSRHTLTIFMIWPYIPSQQDTLEQSFSLSSNNLMYLDNFPLLIVLVLCDPFQSFFFIKLFCVWRQHPWKHTCKRQCKHFDILHKDTTRTTSFWHLTLNQQSTPQTPHVQQETQQQRSVSPTRLQ